MSADLAPRIRLPASARRGEVVEVRVLVQHPMEPGQRRDEAGRLVPRRILHALVVRYLGHEVMRVRLEPAIAANPLLGFFLRAEETGMVELEWTDDDGTIHRSSHRLNVAG
jgi:sulfur-oxidizing protein SoxZ